MHIEQLAEFIGFLVKSLLPLLKWLSEALLAEYLAGSARFSGQLLGRPVGRGLHASAGFVRDRGMGRRSTSRGSNLVKPPA
jgi:hypothetical protein